MTVQRQLFLRTTAIVALLLCSSVLLSGLASVCIAAAIDFNTSAPALRSIEQTVPQDPQPSPIAAMTQTTSTALDPLSQSPVISLVPFELPSADQTAGATPSSTPTTLGPSPGDTAANAAPVAGTTSDDAAPPADAFTTNVTQPAANNASLATIPVSNGGSGNGLLILTAFSYGAAVIVLALMRYWSFSFNEDAEPSSDSRSVDLAKASGAAHSALETVDYGRLTQGPRPDE
jgi:hypothetical protein